jgi:hypothetical protein
MPVSTLCQGETVGASSVGLETDLGSAVGFGLIIELFFLAFLAALAANCF